MGVESVLDDALRKTSITDSVRHRVDSESSYSSDYSIQQHNMDRIVEGKRVLTLDGYSLSVKDLVDCHDGHCRLELSPLSRERIIKARKFLEKIAGEHKIVYGITTGFGTFANVTICPADIRQLQLNLIRSHATGYGDPLSPEKARMLLALRINVLAKGHSGISLQNVEKLHLY
uniref:Histidine ammonia-lyase n=1 Tax=Panagrolaimus superbus TaxID=310955 RepID=A0A914Y0W5_9BILA